MGFSTPEKQRDFWTEFSKSLDGTGFEPRQPTTKNYYYLSAGTSLATIVLTAPTGTGGIACKLALGASESAAIIYRNLHNDREAIESELGFGVEWGVRGTGRSTTRIYRNRHGGIENRSDWPEAFAWLLDTAKRFRQVFVPRIEGIALPPPANPIDDDNAGSPLAPPPDGGSVTRSMPADTISPAPESRAEASESSVHSAPRTGSKKTADALSAIEALGPWSSWMPLAEARAKAPVRPGVYMARLGPQKGSIIYIGIAGERAGSGRPQGIRGRLSAYHSGKGLVSGLGEAALDRALADPAWLGERAAEVKRGVPRRAKDWGREAILRADLHVRWLACDDKAEASRLERECQLLLAGTGLWNRRS